MIISKGEFNDNGEVITQNKGFYYHHYYGLKRSGHLCQYTDIKHYNLSGQYDGEYSEYVNWPRFLC